MSTTTTQRRTSTARRGASVSRAQGQYSGCSQPRSAAARAYEYPAVYPEHKTRPAAPARPRPRTGERKPKTAQVRKGKAKTAVRSADRVNMFRIFMKIGGVFLLCFLMIYRYAVILETNDEIKKLSEECAAIEAANQSIQSKIDRGLELGALEEYATTQLGMIRPDSSQIFYIDMRLGDTAQTAGNEGEEAENHALQGTPGALVHAIQVLK